MKRLWKIIPICLVALALVLSITALTPKAEATSVISTGNYMTVVADKTEVVAGDEIKFTVSVDIVETCRNFGAILDFDRDIFEFVNAKFDRNFGYDADDNDMTLVKSVKATAGQEGFAVAFNPMFYPSEYSGKVLTYTLKVKDNAEFVTTSVSGKTSLEIFAADGSVVDGVLEINTVEIAYAAPVHVHTWVEYAAVAPTCLFEGNIAYKQCSDCGEAWSLGENPIPLSRYGWVLNPTNAHTLEHYDAIAPTCDTQGHEAFDYCTTCESFFYADPMKLTYQAGIILPLGHAYANGNCTQCGAADPGYVPGVINFMTVVPDKTEVVAGDVVNFAVSVDIAETCRNFGLILYFDRDVFEFVNAKFDRNFGYDTDDNDMTIVKSVKTTAGQEGFAVAFNPMYYPSQYAGKVLTYTLKVKDDAEFVTTSVSGKTSLEIFAADGSVVDGVLEINTVEISNIPATEPTEPTEPEHTHAWVEHAAVAPTCDTNGNIAYKQCADCGEAWSLGENPMPLSRYGWLLSATGHTYANGNCTQCGAADPDYVPAVSNYITISPDVTEVVAGDEIKFTVSVDIAEICRNFGVILDFDRDIFEFVNAKFDRNFGYDADDNDITLVKSVSTQAGQEGFAVAFNPAYYPSEYSGKVVTFTLKVKENAEFNTALITGKTSMEVLTAGGLVAEGVLDINTVEITYVPATEPTEPEHTHTWVEYAAVAPTCDTDGNIAYKQCSECGEAWSLDETPVMLAKDRWVLIATGHTWTDIAAVEPTCYADGNIAYQQCSVCGAAQTAGENPVPLGKFGWVLGAQHTALVHYEAVAPTCDKNGHEAFDYCEECQVFIYADPLKLTYQDGVILARGHTYANGSCTQCGAADPDYDPVAIADFNGDGAITNKDVLRLLWHILFPEEYPVALNPDLNGDGGISNKDVLLLLWHTLFPESFPL